MRVWLLHIGEDLPVDGAVRQFRYGYLAEALAERGHHVVRWSPTFRHNTKRHRFFDERRVEITPRYTIQFVHSPGYRRTTSIARLRTYQILSRRFRRLARFATPPDVIVAAIPSLEWAVASVDYGRARGVPVIVDVRDLWPDVFPSSLPFGAQSIGRLLLAPYQRMARHACRSAATLAAVSESYLNWGLRHAGRQRTVRDHVLPLGFEPTRVEVAESQQCQEALRARGIEADRPVCLFAGGFERHHEVEVIIEAARRLTATGRGDVQFVLCGDGSKMAAIRRQAEGAANVHLMGLVDATTLQALASISVVGLCAYSPGALMSLGNKPFEYMAGRLAIVSSLPGELADLLRRHDCGVIYRAGDACSLAGCLARLLDDPDRLEVMRENAYQAWSKNYRTTQLYPQFAAHLEAMTATATQAA
jgi:glycosyltransferase involved in cell wall biosynthesis